MCQAKLVIFVEVEYAQSSNRKDHDVPNPDI